MKNCIYCGNLHNKNGKTCSSSCSGKYANKIKIEKGISTETRNKIRRASTKEKVIINKICINCGNIFNVSRVIQKDGSTKELKHERKCCSIRCARSFASKEKREDINKKLSDKLKGKPNLKLRKHFKNTKSTPLEDRKCLLCNNTFLPKKDKQLYCSNICARKTNIKKAYSKQKENPPNWSVINKNSYLNGTNHIGGGKTKWYSYKNIKVQGTYELRTCKILDAWKDSNLINDWEYTNDRFKYIGVDNKEHTYLIDFKIIKNDKSFYYLETKGFKKENDDLKWNSVRNSGHRLDVWFEEDILKHENLGS
jgi:hypothetical protein